MNKIKVMNPVVDLDGDEMTRVIWAQIKENFFSLPGYRHQVLRSRHRESRCDGRQSDRRGGLCHQGIRRRRQVRDHHPDEARVKEFNLKKMWKSPNGTIRNILGGTVFRQPIICRNVPRLVPAGRSRSSSAVTRSAISIGRPTSSCLTGQADDQVHAAGRRRRDRTGGVRVSGRRRRHGDVQPRRVDPRLRSGLLQLRPRSRLVGVPVDQEHHPQGLRRTL